MFAIDFKGHENLNAQEVPSVVGMRGFYIGGPIDDEYDFWKYRVDSMLAEGVLRPASWLGPRYFEAKGA